MKKYLIGIAAFAIFLFVGVSTTSAVSAYFNGFETDTDGWFTDGSTINRVTSGTGGVTSSDGSYHAELIPGAFTRWGGYESAFPTNGYVTSVDIYLDMSLADETDKRFDFSSAINDPSGTHRRDFIFSAGTIPGVSNQWAVSASNNSPGWPNNPARNPLAISESGWYTFEHTFMDDGSGVLAVVMKVKDDSGVELASWTLSDPTDVIGSTVGGNRYGWLVTSAFSTLAFDNTEKYDIVVDDEAPVVMIDAPSDGATVSGMVDVYGTVTDDNPHHYWLVIQDASNATVAGPGVVNDTSSFTNQNLMTWDTTLVPDGTYTIKLEARDAYDNKDAGSVDWHTVTVENLVGPPTDKNECKDEGWMSFNNPTFKNQGDCVSYVQSNENAKGNKNK